MGELLVSGRVILNLAPFFVNLQQHLKGQMPFFSTRASKNKWAHLLNCREI